MKLPLVLVLMQATASLSIVTDWIREKQDVIHYDITLAIPDRGSVIRGSTRVSWVVHDPETPLLLDFDRHLTIDSVTSLTADGAHAVDWEWTEHGQIDVLTVEVGGEVGDTLTTAVHYRGSPTDGLIIGSNVYGDRTVFADNWPNRAHHWFPSEDHPSDKATVDFHVTAPATWRVVANGHLAGVDSSASGRTEWHWTERRPIPVHTMVTGGGMLAVAELGDVDGAPQSVWVFPQDSAFAVDEPFLRAREMAEALTATIGPFPFDKLAHVESATRYGGMENSSAIFYNQHVYARRIMDEGLVAHELAHQWFGDALAQADWHHLWLSEGFATYFGSLTFDLLGEPERFQDAMRGAKSSYMSSGSVGRPVIDTAEHNLMALLNANNYQKGSWILHMLRAELGDSTFFAGIRDYYRSFRDSSLLSDDLSAVVSRVAGRPLEWFFQQWLLQPGYPQIDARWRFDSDSMVLVLAIDQVQPQEWGEYEFRLPLRLQSSAGESESKIVRVSGRSWQQRIPVGITPTEVILDPDDTLLLRVVRLSLQ